MVDMLSTIDWVSATAVRNWMIKDPLLDWLCVRSRTLTDRYPSYKEPVKKALVSQDTEDNYLHFSKFLMSQGRAFETSIIKHIATQFNVIDIGGNKENALTVQKYEETITAMKNGVPIIYSGVLHNSDNGTYGIPDLLVRSDYLRKLVNVSPMTRCEEHVNTPVLNHDYHYRVIDIKFSTLDMKCDATHLRDSGNYPAYKAQVYIYNEALSKTQGYNPRVAYILGRRWKASVNGSEERGESALERLGIVDFRYENKLSDVSYAKDVPLAIEWVRRVRKEGHEWSPFDMKIPELFPNMSNTNDYPWRPVKELIAKEIGEITMLWMCGPKNRRIAHSKGIYRWTDERCTAKSCGVNGVFTNRVLNEIISINRPTVPIGTVLPKFIHNNDRGWQKRDKLELFVDFETVSDIVTDFSTIPKVECSNMVAIIGVGYMNMGRWRFKTFNVNELSTSEEKRICTEFLTHVNTLKHKYRCKNPLVTHWGHAEQSSWNTVCSRHRFTAQYAYLKWFDLCNVFKTEPIVVKGCMNFSLKTIAKEMYNSGLISSTWSSDTISDGATAMITLHRDKRSRTNNSNEVVKYNEDDCKVVQEILYYLRSNHCATKEKVLNHIKDEHMSQKVAKDYISTLDTLSSGDIAYIEKRLFIDI